MCAIYKECKLSIAEKQQLLKQHRTSESSSQQYIMLLQTAGLRFFFSQCYILSLIQYLGEVNSFLSSRLTKE